MSKSAKDDPLLTVPQAAARLGISRDTVYRLCRDGKLRHYKPASRATRIRASDVDAYLESTLNMSADAPDPTRVAQLRQAVNFIHMRNYLPQGQN